MPKEYVYNGTTFDAQFLINILGDDVIAAETAVLDRMVATRDKGAAQVLADYRKRLGL